MRDVPQDDRFSADTVRKLPDAEIARQSMATMKGLSGFVDKITPWLFAVGNWICGGLTAFALVAISALLTVGPVDKAVLISITAFACALPLNVSTIFLLRMVKDAKEIRVDEVALRAFQDAAFPNIETYFHASSERESRHKRISKAALGYCLGAGSLGTALTLVGLVSALWHMAWWIGAVLIAMVLLCFGASLSIFAAGCPPVPEENERK